MSIARRRFRIIKEIAEGGFGKVYLAEQISFALNVNTIYLPARENQPELAAVMNHAMPPKGRAGSFTYQSVPGIVLFNHTEGIDRDAAKQFLRDFYSVGQYADFIKEGEGYLVPVGRVFENLPIWPDDPKLAITREVAKVGRPDGFELPSRSRLSGLMQERVTIGKMFSEACSSGDARAALDAALKEIEELKAQVGEG